MPELKTIKVVNPEAEGFMIINAEDFDPKQHTKWEQRPQTKKSSPKKTSEETSESSPEQTEAEQILTRVNELEEVYQSGGWRAIADLAENLGIEKPNDGWRSAIPLIAQKEMGINEPDESNSEQA